MNPVMVLPGSNQFFPPILTNIGMITAYAGMGNKDVQDWICQFGWVADINQWGDEV